MANRKAKFRDYYLQENSLGALLRKSVADSARPSRYQFRGNAVTNGLVVRCDLNGYSAWSKDKEISDRVALLDDFFKKVISFLDDAGGVYIRDEGDCIVAVFSEYFGTLKQWIDAYNFAKSVVGLEYGIDKLRAKSVIAFGDFAVYQKSPEVGTEDWSVEGQVFVDTIRIEAAVESKPRIYVQKPVYENLFKPGINYVSPGASAPWYEGEKSYQVVGCSFSGHAGWTELVFVEHQKI